MNLSLVDPTDDDVRSVDGAVLGEAQPDVAVRTGLDFERYVVSRYAPQQPVVIVQKHRMIPMGSEGTADQAHTHHH